MSLCQFVKTWKVCHLSCPYRYKIWTGLPPIMNKKESLIVVPWDGKRSCSISCFFLLGLRILQNAGLYCSFSCYAIPMCIQFHYIIVYSDYFSIVALISSGLFFPSTAEQTFFHWQTPHPHFSVLVFEFY